MKLKLFFFDMEGTLISSGAKKKFANHGMSMWPVVAEALGPDAEAHDLNGVTTWDSGGFPNYLAWCDYCLHGHKKFGLTKTLFDEIMERAQLNAGVSEVIAALHAQGVKTAIVSGGFMAQARRIQKLTGIHHAYAAAEHIWADDGTVQHWNILPSDNVGKVDFVELLLREYNVTAAECAFVGDGRNDVHIAQHVGLSFAYNAHPDLQKVATHSISDFREILEHL